MTKLIYKNARGQSLEFGNSPPAVITSIEGLGSPENTIHRTKSPYQDGSSVISSNLEDREIVLEGAIFGLDRTGTLDFRNRLLSLFNPKLPGELIFEIGGAVKKVDCIPELAPFFPGQMQESYQTFSVQLLCPNPFLLDAAVSKADISTETGNIEFPLEILAEGLELSIRTISFITNIYNRGDVETPIKVKLKAVGTVINPIIENLDTGEYIRIKRTLLEGETLEINTAFGNKRVEIIKPDESRENVFHYIDYKSTFFGLSSGDNTIEYDAEIGENNLDVSIYYTPRYLGV